VPPAHNPSLAGLIDILHFKSYRTRMTHIQLIFTDLLSVQIRLIRTFPACHPQAIARQAGVFHHCPCPFPSPLLHLSFDIRHLSFKNASTLMTQMQLIFTDLLSVQIRLIRIIPACHPQAIARQAGVFHPCPFPRPSPLLHLSFVNRHLSLTKRCP